MYVHLSKVLQIERSIKLNKLPFVLINTRYKINYRVSVIIDIVVSVLNMFVDRCASYLEPTQSLPNSQAVQVFCKYKFIPLHFMFKNLLKIAICFF